MKLSSILGLNARSQLYLSGNSRPAKRIADSKIMTFRTLKNAGIPTPEIYKKFREPSDVFNFDFNKLPASFAVKPSRGFGGEGIIVVKKKAKDGASWITTQRKKVTVDDLRLHILDILEGAYSLGNVPDVAFIQEYVGRHTAFRRYAYRGTPDIRVITFNKVPVMAMLRLPTKESGGRANLHQGAIAVGIDIATGITTKAIVNGEQIKYKPETNRKLHGIKIPTWTKILQTAVEAQIASGLNYLGVDIVLHPDKGPMVLELNARPGLQIQMANGAGLKKRLERVEDLDIRDVEHGVKIGKALFAERHLLDRTMPDEGVKTVNAIEEIKIVSASKKKFKTIAKIDTGAWRTSIDINLAKELGLLKKENIIKNRVVRSSLGKEERPVIVFEYWLKGYKITTAAGVTDRKAMKRKVIIGRKDLGRFLINPLLEDEKKWVVV